MRDVVDECQAVAKAEGVQVAGDVEAAVAQLAGSMPNQYASTAQDLARGKRTEIDYRFNDAIRASFLVLFQ